MTPDDYNNYLHDPRIQQLEAEGFPAYLAIDAARRHGVPIDLHHAARVLADVNRRVDAILAVDYPDAFTALAAEEAADRAARFAEQQANLDAIAARWRGHDA